MRTDSVLRLEAMEALIILLRRLNVAPDWRDSFVSRAKQNAGEPEGSARLCDKAGRKNSRQDAQCLVGGAIEFGAVDAERFISMIKRDTFDYTEWRRGLWEGKTIEEIHAAATAFETGNKSNI
jgi:hypothetical protein